MMRRFKSKQLKEIPNYNRELQIVSPPSSSTDLSIFKLPRDWVVKKRISPSVAGRVDKYYYHPITGQQFRSLLAVRRYLHGEPIKPRRKRNTNIVPYTYKSSSVINLPNNWIVEEKPRRNGNYAGIVDRYFIDTETGIKFRSFKSAQRYLQQMDEELKAASQSAKKQKTRMDGSSDRPEKVKWLLSGPGGNMWKALIGESMVSESIKQNWSETFVSRIQDKH